MLRVLGKGWGSFGRVLREPWESCGRESSVGVARELRGSPAGFLKESALGYAQGRLAGQSPGTPERKGDGKESTQKSGPNFARKKNPESKRVGAVTEFFSDPRKPRQYGGNGREKRS